MAAWLAKGFTPTFTAPWVDHNESPKAIAHLQQNITPSEAAEWLKTGIDFRVLIKWCKAIPCATKEAAFIKENFSPAEAATWFELKILAPEATCFCSIGWVPDTVVTWLNTNETTYDKIRKYFHPNKGPESAIVWRQRGFAPGEAKLWADLIVDVDLAHTLWNHDILPVTIARFIERKYTLDEAIMYAMEGTPLDCSRSSQNSDHPKMSYSKRVKRGKEPHTSVDITRYTHHKAHWVTFFNLLTDKYSEWVREAIITGTAYYGTILEFQEKDNFKGRCMRPSTLHILLDAALIVRSRNVALPRFVRLPGCNNSVIYVKPENSRQVCLFCFAMGHNIHQCDIKKGVHVRDYEMDVEKGVTRVNRKTYVCPKLVWWIPLKVNEIFAMKAIQQSLVELHKANRECRE
ncbi:hypothetical protein DSO57_1000795 [Entomophthora muscae]|uniref:Uncharacterized protein n=1 Tax=Entomophthora muscae TaxID=34485 RepID=A0ACC2T9B1_9FUNG|nr:hypothetical protein DSO57_1000795 [Entomophthora muscae]